MEPSLDPPYRDSPRLLPWETRDWAQAKFPSTEVVQTGLRSRVELERALAPGVGGPRATVVYPPAVPDPRELRDEGPLRPGVLVLEHSPGSSPLRSALAWELTGEGAGASVVVAFAFALLLWVQRNTPRLVTGAALALAAAILLGWLLYSFRPRRTILLRLTYDPDPTHLPPLGAAPVPGLTVFVSYAGAVSRPRLTPRAERRRGLVRLYPITGDAPTVRAVLSALGAR